MAYREKVWNANVLTDLLSTYLSHKSQEREKYYQAELKAELKKKPSYQQFGKDLLRIDPDGGITTVMTKPTSSSDLRPVYNPVTGETTYETPKVGQQSKPPLSDEIAKEERKSKETTFRNRIKYAENRVEHLEGLKRKTVDVVTGVLKEPAWKEEEHGPELEYYNKVLANTEYLKTLRGRPVYKSGVSQKYFDAWEETQQPPPKRNLLSP